MGYINNLIDSLRKERSEQNRICDLYIKKYDDLTESIISVLSVRFDFVDPEEISKIRTELDFLTSEKTIRKVFSLTQARKFRFLRTKAERIFNDRKKITERLERVNDVVASAYIKSAGKLIGSIEGNQPDFQQMSCIVKDVRNHLVIAGAGTGKTSVAAGKIKYLIRSGKYSPDEILVLSYTNASAQEISQRIKKETGQQIDALTFHKLGMNIIKSAGGQMPAVTKINMRDHILSALRKNMENSAYLDMINNYLMYSRVVSRSEFSFETQEEYDEYLRLYSPVTVNGETVKSYGEMYIANFLTQNSIRYIYENPYFIDTSDEKHSQYCPDFFLPDYNIYIEYFGVDKNGDVPKYFRGEDGLSATESYQRSMKWKRKLHRANSTVMIECFAYELFDGKLLENLRKNLKKHSVEFRRPDPQAVWKLIAAEDESISTGLTELLETLINLIKSRDLTIGDVMEMNRGSSQERSNQILLSILDPVLDSYNRAIHSCGEIDFNDMINLAAQYVREGRYKSRYRFVIVDEYQDISRSRFVLLSELRRSCDYDLMCTGDDWQSIYRFAGSDTGLILDFKGYWGPAEISRIETTYRFSQSLSEISGEFIMQNPAQIRKNIRSSSDSEEFSLSIIKGNTEKNAVSLMANTVANLPSGSTVFFIGRYSFDERILSGSDSFRCRYNKDENRTAVFYNGRQDLRMYFMTAHRSKGLQADYVFIINNKKSRMGFPSRMQDAPVMKLLLDSADRYPYAEERRLFYVAMTRAARKVYLMAVKGQESEFVTELSSRYKDNLAEGFLKCPLCSSRLIKRSGKFGEFYGCSGFITKGCQYKQNISSLLDKT